VTRDAGSPGSLSRAATVGIIATVCLASLTSLLDQGLVVPALPTIKKLTGATQADTAWVMIMYLLSASATTPLLGRLGDLYGYRRVLLWVLGILGLGSLIGAVTTSLPLLLLARLLQGVGNAIFPLGIAIIRQTLPAERVRGAIGLTSAFFGVGSGLGIIAGGYIVALLGVPPLFWIPFGAAIVTIVVCLLLVPPSRAAGGSRVNWLSAVLLGGWLTTLLLPITKGSAWGWGSPLVIGMLAATIVLIALWLLTEQRSSHPTVDLGVLRRGPVWTANLIAITLGAGTSGATTFVPAFVEHPPAAGYGFGSTPLIGALCIAPLSAGILLGGIASGPVSQRAGLRRMVVAGAAVMVVPYAAFALFHDAIWAVYIEMGIAGLGFGFLLSGLNSVITDSVEPAQLGVATGMNAIGRTLGGALGTALVTSIVTAGVVGTAAAPESGYVNGFAALAVVSAIGLVTACVLAGVTRTVPAVSGPAGNALISEEG
jgi:MFS family permease